MSIAGFDPEILQDFLTESGELLEQLEGDLVSLEERASDLELINQVFRALHTIKGSASFLALTNLVAIAHAAESALNAARNGQAVVDKAMMDLLLRAVDLLKTQFGELAGGSTDLTAAEPDLVATLQAIGDGKQAELGGGVAAPAASDDAGGGPSAEGGDEESFALPPEKADLLSHFIEDVDRQLESITEKIALLASDAARAEAAPEIGEIAEDLVATIDFFEFRPMLPLARALGEAGVAAGGAAEETLSQMMPRLEAVIRVMRDQTEALKEQRRPSGRAEALLEQLGKLARGEAVDPSWALPAGATVEDALRLGGGVDDDGDAGAAGVVDVPVEAVTPEAAVPVSEPVPEPVSAARPGPESAPKAEAKGDRHAAAAAEQTIRVEVSRLESLMNLVGELVLQKNRMGELAHRISMAEGVDQDLAEAVSLAGGSLDRVTGEIQVAVMKTRMQPLDKLFGRYPRLIRDLCQKTGKKIKLDVIGGDTEVDKSVIEELGDPLVHLIRNSADHGLEPPAEREASGKGDTGTITLRAAQAGDHVLIEIIDDGRGLNRERIAKKAIEKGLVRESDVQGLSADEVAKFIFLPGFSTAEQVSDLSGRGVGMDVVRTNIEKLKGTITVTTDEGKGTRFCITIPLTVAIMPAMMVAIEGEQYAIPLGSIVEIVRPTERELSTILEERVIRLRDAVMPLVDAHDVFGVPRGEGTGTPLAVVLSGGDKEIGLLVTRVIGQQEVVIKPLDGVESHGPVSGATVRNDGGVSLIMDVAELLRRNGGRG